MDNFLSLAARLEQATEGSRELDSLIYRGWCRIAPPPPRGGAWTTDEEYTPLYTFSVDAALLLKPEHSIWWVGWAEGGHYARVLPPKGIGWLGSREHEGNARTAPLAICAACLRAIAASPKESSGG